MRKSVVKPAFHGFQKLIKTGDFATDFVKKSLWTDIKCKGFPAGWIER
jgi:hypothetical protein